MVDLSNSRSGDENGRQIVASWEAACRRKRHGLDRRSLVAALLAAVGGGALESVRLASTGAAFGADFAVTGGSLAALIGELDELESILLKDLGASIAAASTQQIASAARVLHEKAALTRRASSAAFGQAVGAAGRKRVSIARHDIINAIGAVRNAILLMEDEAGQSAREHFRTMAKRNSRSSEMLVRFHLSDQSALTPALGWEEVSLSDLTASSDQGADRSRVVTDLAALDTMLDVIRAASPTAGNPGGWSVSCANGATSGMLTIKLSTCDDCATASDILNALRDLATMMGLRFEGDSLDRELRLLVPLSGRDEGHDLGGARDSHHTDTVTF